MPLKVKYSYIFCFYFLFTVFPVISFAGIRSQVNSIPTLDSLQNYYTAANLYTRRYVLKELPDWLQMRGYHAFPAWWHNAIDDALSSGEPMLTREAIILTGKYGFQDFSEKLKLIYKNAYKQYAAEADVVRYAVIRAFMDLSSPVADSLIPDLFLHSQRYLLGVDFALLLTAVIQYGNSSCLAELNSLENNLKPLIASIDPVNDPGRLKDQYNQLLSSVLVAQQRLKERGK